MSRPMTAPATQESHHDRKFLEVKNLSVSFGHGVHTVQAVENISFYIKRGETFSLVGESGSGKSVTALSILQLLPYPMAWHPSGSVIVEGMEMVDAKSSTLRAIRGDRISIIFQEPMTSLNPLHTIEKQINESLLLHKGLGRQAARTRTLELLHLVGLHDVQNRLSSYPHELSGGQRQRIMIAMALANEPDLLIADEPTTAVDATVQAQILNLLRTLQSKLGMAILLITHDLSIVRKMATRMAVMQAGAIVEAGEVSKIFSTPQHSYTKKLLAAEPKGQPPSSTTKAASIIAAQNLRVYFPIKTGVFGRTITHVRAVDDITLNVRKGHTLGVVGESGSGKTTLGLALLRLIKSQGRIQFDQIEIQGQSFKKLRPLRSEMQIVFQDPFASLSPRMTIGQIIEEGLTVHGLSGNHEGRRAHAVEAIQEVGLAPDMIDRYPHEFSGGERQRISIARAMVLKPRFIVLDEPTSALDRSVQSQIVDLLRELQQRHNLAYLFISHDLKVIRALSDEILVMRGGKIVESGTADQIFDFPQTEYTKALIKAAFEIETIEAGAIES